MFFRCITLAVAGCTAAQAQAADTPLAVQFSRCTEFVGLQPIDAAAARAQVPPAYTPVTDAAGARLVVRVADCEAVRVGALPALSARPGRVAQIGVMIVSPDGTGTDPNTAINNYTLSYTTNSAALVLALRASGVPATLDAGLAIEAGASGEFYAAVSPELDTDAPTWFLHGRVNTPSFGTSFLANWWRSNGGRETKMATDIPSISFDFGSDVDFTTARRNLVGALLPGNQVRHFPLSFRGAFATGTMLVSVRR
jgi:hypothetical protein